MNAKIKAIIERHKDDLDTNNFENIVRDAVKEDVLDELLDDFYKANITIPPEIVTKQLYDFYITGTVKNNEERLNCQRKLDYLINKHQNIIVKTFDVFQK